MSRSLDTPRSNVGTLVLPIVVCFLLFITGTANADSLHSAAERNDVETIQRLLEAGADPNLADRRNWTPLHHAAQSGHSAAVTALLGAGADPNVRLEGWVKNWNWTPLNYAVEGAHNDIVIALLEAGADPNVGDRHIGVRIAG